MRTVSDESYKENQNIFRNIFPKTARFMRYCGKYGTAGQDTDANVIGRMRFACWINKAQTT
jgi:hypothetical protein